MNPQTRLFIMETFWDRQKYEPASLCLTMTSVYFTAIANGNSKMYHSDDMVKQINRSGLKVVAVHDSIGQGHTILEVKLNKSLKNMMERKEIEEKVKAFLIEDLEIEEDNIAPDAKLKDDLGIDSLDFVDIVVIVEKNFGFKIKPEEMKGVVTLSQFCDYIESKVG